MHFKRFGLVWNEAVGIPECPYLYRWVFTFWGRSIRLHHWVASDDQRYTHDHAWNFTAIILLGEYLEWIDGKCHLRSQGDITSYKAEHKHTVEVITGGCWSLLFTGAPRRKWGFWIPGRDALMRPLRYFSRYGHHPCGDV